MPRPMFMQIFGIWVVLPEPVSPATMTTWWFSIASRMSSTRSETGSPAGKLIGLCRAARISALEVTVIAYYLAHRAARGAGSYLRWFSAAHHGTQSSEALCRQSVAHGRTL